MKSGRKRERDLFGRRQCASFLGLRRGRTVNSSRSFFAIRICELGKWVGSLYLDQPRTTQSRKARLQRKRKKSFGVRFEYVSGRNCGAEKVSGELPARDNHATGPR